jgi:hypothetical protein
MLCHQGDLPNTAGINVSVELQVYLFLTKPVFYGDFCSSVERFRQYLAASRLHGNKIVIPFFEYCVLLELDSRHLLV